MTVLRRVRNLLTTPEVIYECRQCGATLETISDTCEVCGSRDVARYVIE